MNQTWPDCHAHAIHAKLKETSICEAQIGDKARIFSIWDCLTPIFSRELNSTVISLYPLLGELHWGTARVPLQPFPSTPSKVPEGWKAASSGYNPWKSHVQVTMLQRHWNHLLGPDWRPGANWTTPPVEVSPGTHFSAGTGHLPGSDVEKHVAQMPRRNPLVKDLCKHPRP